MYAKSSQPTQAASTERRGPAPPIPQLFHKHVHLVVSVRLGGLLFAHKGRLTASKSYAWGSLLKFLSSGCDFYCSMYIEVYLTLLPLKSKVKVPSPEASSRKMQLRGRGGGTGKRQLAAAAATAAAGRGAVCLPSSQPAAVKRQLHALMQLHSESQWATGAGIVWSPQHNQRCPISCRALSRDWGAVRTTPTRTSPCARG